MYCDSVKPLNIQGFFVFGEVMVKIVDSIGVFKKTGEQRYWAIGWD